MVFASEVARASTSAEAVDMVTPAGKKMNRANGQQDKGDEGHAGHAIGFEAVRAGADGVACVVARAIGNDAGVARIVFLDLEDDLHQVGTDVRNLGEDSAGDAERGRTQ